MANFHAIFFTHTNLHNNTDDDIGKLSQLTIQDSLTGENSFQKRKKQSEKTLGVNKGEPLGGKEWKDLILYEK